MKHALLLLTILLSHNLFTQERVLLHIGRDGKQEAIPLGKNQHAQDVIARIENQKTSLVNPNNSNGLTDSLKNYPGDANSVATLTTNFGITHQDVLLQWFEPSVGGRIKEFWWRNNSEQGFIKKGTVRAWYVNPKLANRPASVITKYLGSYKDPTDGDGLVTPFKPITGDQWFYGNSIADSAAWRFDPLGTEVPTWQPGGLQVSLDSGKWQGIILEDWGDSMFVNQGQLFGFTLSDDTKVTDKVDAGPDIRMEILSWANTNPAPFHSYKFYETGRTSSNDKGWHLRGDYEWGMYVVMEYTSVPPTRITIHGTIATTLKTTPRPITATVTDDNPGGGPSGVAAVYLKTKKGALASYDSVLTIASGSAYTGYTPSTSPGDTVYWAIVAYDTEGNRTVFGPRSYVVFKNTKPNLFLYNFPGYSSPFGMDFIYVGNSSQFNRWSAINDGTEELTDMLELYNDVVVADGSFPSRNIYPSLKTWLEHGTAASKKNLFFTSQDYGCYITNTCLDTTFVPGSFEYDFLGIQTLGPQDLGPTNKPFQLIPQPDPSTNYLIKYNTDSSTTLWHHPTFEISSSFSAYPDAMTPKVGAKALFKDGTGTNTLGVLNQGATFNSMFIAFDAAGLQFRSDTSISPVTDPKYRWILDVGALSVEFLKQYSVSSAKEDVVLRKYALSQNYPNPFNPITTIEYEIPVNGVVTLTIFDLLGREVTKLVNGEQQEGRYTIGFDAANISSGLYFYRLQSGSFIDVKKMMVLK